MPSLCDQTQAISCRSASVKKSSFASATRARRCQDRRVLGSLVVRILKKIKDKSKDYGDNIKTKFDNVVSTITSNGKEIIQEGKAKFNEAKEDFNALKDEAKSVKTNY